MHHRNGVSLYTVRITAATQILLEEEQPSSSMRIFLPKATENVASIGESIMDRNSRWNASSPHTHIHTYRASAYKYNVSWQLFKNLTWVCIFHGSEPLKSCIISKDFERIRSNYVFLRKINQIRLSFQRNVKTWDVRRPNNDTFIYRMHNCASCSRKQKLQDK